MKREATDIIYTIIKRGLVDVDTTLEDKYNEIVKSEGLSMKIKISIEEIRKYLDIETPDLPKYVAPFINFGLTHFFAF